MTNDAEPGSDIAGYILERQLGGGGFGAVWRARDSRTGDIVAVKLLTGAFSENTGGLRADIELLAATASGRSEHVVKVLGGGSHPVPHVVMEFIDGTDLAARLREGVLTREETINVGLGVADALRALEDAGIVHRDVKPANVMIDTAGVVKLTDFGIAKIVGYDTITMTGQLPMTMAYAAPEVWEGTSTHRSDIYALGVLLYQCLHGAPPFVGNYGTLFKQHTTDLPDLDALPLETPPSLRELIRACMEKDPDARPRDGAACVALLHQAAAELTAPAAPEPERFGPWIRQRRHPLQPWAWRCVHQDTGEPAVVEIHASGEVTEGARLRDAVTANAYLSPFGAETLLGTNRVLLRPGESWHEAPAGDLQFWVARNELQSERPPDEVTVPRLRRAVDALLSLIDVAATQGITLSLAPALVSMRGDGSVHVKRPGLVAPDGDPLEQGLAFLRSLPLDEDARALATDAPDLRTLRSWLPLSGAAPVAAIGIANAAEGSAEPHGAPTGTTIFTAPILRDDTAVPLPVYAPMNTFVDAPSLPVKRGWFHAGVRIARMYWYVGVGVTTFVGVMMLGVTYAIDMVPGGNLRGSESSLQQQARVDTGARSATPKSGVTVDGATATAAVVVWASGLATAEAAGSLVAAPPQPTRIGDVAGIDATPRPGETRISGEPNQPAVIPPGGGPTNVPVSTIPPVIGGNEPTPTPVIVAPPPPTNTPMPTNTPSPPPNPMWGTNNTWDVYDGPFDLASTNYVGKAQHVCLNAGRPADCPPDAVIYNYDPTKPAWGGSGLYPYVFGGAHWIWIPGVAATTPEDGKKYYFKKTFTLSARPSYATLTMMVSGATGYYASIYVNDRLLVSKEGVFATSPWESPDLTSKLRIGQNTIGFELRSELCDPPCTYQQKPIGFIVGNSTSWR